MGNVGSNMQHGKRAEAMLKSERQHLYHIYWSLRTQFWLEKLLWVIWKFFGLFISQLTADDRYCLINKGNSLQHVQMQLSQKQKLFSTFFFFFLQFLNLHLILKFFRKEMTVIPDVFLNWGPPKNVVRWMSKKSRFRGPFNK